MGDALLEQQLRTLADHLPFDVWVRDRDDRCVYANPTALGRWPGLLGKTTLESDLPAEVALVWRGNNERVLGGEVVRGEVTYSDRTPPQVVFNLLAPVRGADGSVVGSVGVNVDITAQRTAEAAAEERRALIHTMFDATLAAMGVREEEGTGDLRHVLDNATTSALFGRSHPRETMGKTDAELGVPELTRRRVRAVLETLTPGAVRDFEYVFPAADGPRVFEGRMAAVKTPADAPRRFFFIADDLTERRRLEAELVRGERLASLGALAASIAHEIKNPATTVLLSLDHVRYTLEREFGALSPSARARVDESLAAAIQGVEHITTLVRDFGVLAKPTDAKQEDVQVDEVVRSVLGLLRAALTVRATVDVQYGTPPIVRANGVRLAQVLINLLNNATEALARAERRGMIVVRTERVGERVRIDVSDDGPGLAPAIEARLFQPFATGSSEGTGLGLYLSRQIVAAYGGTIDFVARDAPGALFRIELPVAAGPVA